MAPHEPGSTSYGGSSWSGSGDGSRWLLLAGELTESQISPQKKAGATSGTGKRTDQRHYRQNQRPFLSLGESYILIEAHVQK